MTYKAFLAALRKKIKEENIRWHITRSGEIRTKDGRCPLGIFTVSDAPWGEDATKEFGLERDASHYISDAADWRKTHYPDVRRDLLRACGLKERP